MNRINKRKQYERGYYQTHPCTDSFTCRVCGRPVDNWSLSSPPESFSRAGRVAPLPAAALLEAMSVRR